MASAAISQTSTQTTLVRGPVAGAFQSLLQAGIALHRRQVTRRQLQGLTLEQLRDVGIDPDVISRRHDVPGDPWTMSRLMSLR
jgi:uncharacterized protein YjiS (DUF1127 family)